MNAEHFTELEVTLHGLVFLVTGTYFPPDSGDAVNPPVQEEFDINNHLLRVKGQPEANGREILNAMSPAPSYLVFPGTPKEAETGREQLEDAILRLIGVHNV